MNTILCKVSGEDAKNLYDTIVEVEACRELYDTAKGKADCTPFAFKSIMDYFMQSLKVHKTLWKDLVIKYLGEDVADFDLLRFDPVKKVIFRPGECLTCEK